MVAALVILDGASEPLGPAPTSLERAGTPALDALGREGGLSRVRTVAPAAAVPGYAVHHLAGHLHAAVPV